MTSAPASHIARATGNRGDAVRDLGFRTATDQGDPQGAIPRQPGGELRADAARAANDQDDRTRTQGGCRVRQGDRLHHLGVPNPLPPGDFPRGHDGGLSQDQVGDARIGQGGGIEVGEGNGDPRIFERDAFPKAQHRSRHRIGPFPQGRGLQAACYNPQRQANR